MMRLIMLILHYYIQTIVLWVLAYSILLLDQHLTCLFTSPFLMFNNLFSPLSTGPQLEDLTIWRYHNPIVELEKEVRRETVKDGLLGMTRTLGAMGASNDPGLNLDLPLHRFLHRDHHRLLIVVRWMKPTRWAKEEVKAAVPEVGVAKWVWLEVKGVAVVEEGHLLPHRHLPSQHQLLNLRWLWEQMIC